MQSSAELRMQAQQATSEAFALADRLGVIDQEIAAREDEIAQTRIMAARNGQAPSGAAAPEKAELSALLEEREDLPERHMAAREEAAALAIATESALIEEVEPQIAAARADLVPVEEEFAAAEAALTAQKALLSQLEGVRWTARERRRRDEKLLEQIAREGIRPVA